MKDGLYLVDRANIYAAFVVRGGEVTTCAPILRKNLGFYQKIARFLGNGPEEQPTESAPPPSRAARHRGRAVSRERGHGEAEASPSRESEDQCPPVWRTGCE